MLPLLLLSLKYTITSMACTSCTGKGYIKKNLKKLCQKQEAKFLPVSVTAMPIYSCYTALCL